MSDQSGHADRERMLASLRDLVASEPPREGGRPDLAEGRTDMLVLTSELRVAEADRIDESGDDGPMLLQHPAPPEPPHESRSGTDAASAPDEGSVDHPVTDTGEDAPSQARVEEPAFEKATAPAPDDAEARGTSDTHMAENIEAVLQSLQGDVLEAERNGVDRDAFHAPRTGGTASVDLAADGPVIDEAALREVVSEIVRQELQGAMGERITRNVRKLVRREIMRAISVRDLD